MSLDFFKKGYISEKTSQIFVITVFLLFWLVYTIFRFLHFQNYAQIAIDVLMHLSFLGLVIILLKKHGFWTIPFVIVSFFIISYSEIQSVWVLNTYEYSNWPSGIFLWTYPTTIGIGWVYLCYCTYLLTNILLLNREHSNGFVDGHNYLPGKPFYKSFIVILFLSFIDGLFLFHFGVLNETTGIDLEFWFYYPSNEPRFFDAPTKTLFTYFLASFIFNAVFRILEYISNEFRNNKTLSFKRADIYLIYLFFLYWFFLIFESITKFGIDHWSVFVSGPIIIIIFSIVIRKFYYNQTFIENSNI